MKRAISLLLLIVFLTTTFGLQAAALDSGETTVFESAGKPQTEAATESQTETQTETQTDPKIESETATETETETETEAETEPVDVSGFVGADLAAYLRTLGGEDLSLALGMLDDAQFISLCGHITAADGLVYSTTESFILSYTFPAPTGYYTYGYITGQALADTLYYLYQSDYLEFVVAANSLDDNQFDSIVEGVIDYDFYINTLTPVLKHESSGSGQDYFEPITMQRVFTDYSLFQSYGDMALTSSGDPIWPAEGSILIDKFKESTAVDGLYKITLNIDGKNKQDPADIVLVIDVSRSMAGTKITNAISAAKAFIDCFKQEDGTLGKTKVAIVTFSTNASVKSGLTNNYTALYNIINGLSANGNTSIQSGLYMARQILEDTSQSTSPNKAVVLLGDGEPNCSYTASATAVDPVFKCDGNNGKKHDLQDYTLYTIDSVNYGRTVSSSNITVYATCPHGHTFTSTKTDIPRLTYYEADLIKNNNIPIYTIAFNATTGTDVLNKIATDSMHAKTVDSEDDIAGLTAAFKQIAGAVNVAATGGLTTDPIGPMFDLYQDAGHPITCSPGTTFTVSSDGRTIYWTTQKVSEGNTLALSYYVSIKTGAGGAQPNILYPTNGTTTFDYTNVYGRQSEKLYPIPEAGLGGGTILIYTYLVNSSGQPINSLGQVVDSPQNALISPNGTYYTYNGSQVLAYDTYNITAPVITGYTPTVYTFSGALADYTQSSVVVGTTAPTIINSTKPNMTVYFGYTVTGSITVHAYRADANGNPLKADGTAAASVAEAQQLATPYPFLSGGSASLQLGGYTVTAPNVADYTLYGSFVDTGTPSPGSGSPSVSVTASSLTHDVYFAFTKNLPTSGKITLRFLSVNASGQYLDANGDVTASIASAKALKAAYYYNGTETLPLGTYSISADEINDYYFYGSMLDSENAIMTGSGATPRSIELTGPDNERDIYFFYVKKPTTGTITVHAYLVNGGGTPITVDGTPANIAGSYDLGMMPYPHNGGSIALGKYAVAAPGAGKIDAAKFTYTGYSSLNLGPAQQVSPVEVTITWDGPNADIYFAYKASGKITRHYILTDADGNFLDANGGTATLLADAYVIRTAEETVCGVPAGYNAAAGTVPDGYVSTGYNTDGSLKTAAAGESASVSLTVENNNADVYFGYKLTGSLTAHYYLVNADGKPIDASGNVTSVSGAAEVKPDVIITTVSGSGPTTELPVPGTYPTSSDAIDGHTYAGFYTLDSDTTALNGADVPVSLTVANRVRDIYNAYYKNAEIKIHAILVDRDGKPLDLSGANAAASGAIELADTVSRTSGIYTPGSFTVNHTENAPDGYTYAGVWFTSAQTSGTEGDAADAVLAYDRTSTDIYFGYRLLDLKITKTVEGTANPDPDQSFIFVITKEGDPSFMVYEVIQGQGDKVIKNLAPGVYTVTELIDWSWRYGPKDGTAVSQTVALTATGGNVTESSVTDSSVTDGNVTFTNIKKKDKRLSGETFKINTFSGGTPSGMSAALIFDSLSSGKTDEE